MCQPGSLNRYWKISFAVSCLKQHRNFQKWTLSQQNRTFMLLATLLQSNQSLDRNYNISDGIAVVHWLRTLSFEIRSVELLHIFFSSVRFYEICLCWSLLYEDGFLVGLGHYRTKMCASEDRQTEWFQDDDFSTSPHPIHRQPPFTSSHRKTLHQK